MMNKKEQARFVEMQKLLRLKGALRATSPVPPDVPIPTDISSALSTGFLPSGSGEWAIVEVACSSSISHAIGRSDKVTSQHPRELYSTRLRGLRALRYEIEQDSARHLARIDEMIEAEEQKDSTATPE